MGLFIRKCVIEYASLPFSQLLDIQGAFDLYIHHTSGDTEFLSSTNKKPDLWISDYNVQEFLDHQAEKIERRFVVIYGMGNVLTVILIQGPEHAILNLLFSIDI